MKNKILDLKSFKIGDFVEVTGRKNRKGIVVFVGSEFITIKFIKENLIGKLGEYRECFDIYDHSVIIRKCNDKLL